MSTAVAVTRESAPPIYGRQTRLALENFPAGTRRGQDPPEFVRAYALVKAAAAQANMELGVLDAERGAPIVAAATEVAEGNHSDQFPVPLMHGGGGTSANMNINEVLATRATQRLAAAHSDLTVHPNDHVNASQSTNDTYPTAMAITLLDRAAPALAALAHLREAFLSKAAEYDEQPRLGRTCLQDAVPLTVGQTHRAQAAGIERVHAQLHAATTALHSVPLGATAVGTGLGAPAGYSAIAVEHLAVLTGHDLTLAEDFFDALAHLDPYATLAGACSRAAIILAKIAADLRLLSSGPTGGLGEITLPALQAGSSIMPGKVNPVIPELVMQLSYRIRGAGTTVELAVAAGELELNVMEPVILDALTTSLADLTDAATYFADKCITGLVWNSQALQRNLAGSRHDYVEIAARAGYDVAAASAQIR